MHSRHAPILPFRVPSDERMPSSFTSLDSRYCRSTAAMPGPALPPRASPPPCTTSFSVNENLPAGSPLSTPTTRANTVWPRR